MTTQEYPVQVSHTSVNGQQVRWYSAGPEDAPTVALWHHGTPNIGEPPAPLLAASAKRGIRWIGFDRPGYGGTPRAKGRAIADVAPLVLGVLDEAGVDRAVSIGHSGGGPHALASAAFLPERILAVVSVSGLAPREAMGREWYQGMYRTGVSDLLAAEQGESARMTLARVSEFDPAMFTQADIAALEGTWSWFNAIAAAGTESGLGGLVDDDVAYVSQWGFDPRTVTAPVLVVHGDQDRIVPVAQARWLAENLPHVTFSMVPGAGHISALGDGAALLDWVAAQS